ncbi:Peptidyl-prolyl cis-trans isomerase CWC27 -like protein, partial [Capsicum annuum]
MSTVYVLEPPTKGKVVLNTTYGPLDIELWPKEAPKAVRNFVQLCLEGYYDNTIFHRVIKSFLIQGGDPTGTGTGGESIYGGVFPDEFHSRLRFKHRGLVACAGAGSPNSNASQFFMTLDRCDFLDKKHTIFGKVTGDSIYNLITLGEVETDKDDRPVDPPPKILSVEVLWSPFEDVFPRAKPAKALPSGVTTEKKDAKQKATKKLNLLSFGEEAEEEEKELVAVSARIRSSHDVLDDPRLLKEGKDDQALDSSEGKSTRDVQVTIREALGSKKEASRKESEAGFQEFPDNSDEDEADFDARMRQQILKRRKELGDPPSKQKLLSENGNARNRSPSPTRY